MNKVDIDYIAGWYKITNCIEIGVGQFIFWDSIIITFWFFSIKVVQWE